MQRPHTTSFQRNNLLSEKLNGSEECECWGFPPDSGGFLSPTCTMVLLKLHCDVTEATLSAFVAMVRGGREGGSLTRLTEPPAEENKSNKFLSVIVLPSRRWAHMNKQCNLCCRETNEGLLNKKKIPYSTTRIRFFLSVFLLVNTYWPKNGKLKISASVKANV